MIAAALLAQARGALPLEERLRGLRDVPAAGADSPWLWPALVGGGVVVIAAAVLIHLARRRGRIRAAWGEFTRLAQEAGLSDEERGLVAAIARLAGLGRSPQGIFTDEKAFGAGLARLVDSGRPGRASGHSYAMCTRCIYLVSLHEKLGFEPTGSGKEVAQAIQLGYLEPGTALTVFRQTRPENLQVFVTGRRDQGRELFVLPEVPLEAHAGETWTVRYPRAGTLWEFDAKVVSNMADEIVIRPGGQARWVNRRRFARVPVCRPAQVALFPFHRAEGNMSAPEFVPARLVDIGGPGMRIEASLEAAVGDRLLVVAELPNRVMEIMGMVRHVRPAEGEQWQIALELTGLDTSQIAELTQVTNELAPRGEDATDESEPAVAHLREASDG